MKKVSMLALAIFGIMTAASAQTNITINNNTTCPTNISFFAHDPTNPSYASCSALTSTSFTLPGTNSISFTNIADLNNCFSVLPHWNQVCSGGGTPANGAMGVWDRFNFVMGLTVGFLNLPAGCFGGTAPTSSAAFCGSSTVNITQTLLPSGDVIIDFN